MKIESAYGYNMQSGFIEFHDLRAWQQKGPSQRNHFSTGTPGTDGEKTACYQG